MNEATVISIVPLAGLSNHRMPQKIDKSDLVSWHFNYKNKTNSLVFPARTRYDFNEEFTFSYSEHNYPAKLLYNYGMAFDNNPFSIVGLNSGNIIKQLD